LHSLSHKLRRLLRRGHGRRRCGGSFGIGFATVL
jgi:hypothetical protein